MSVTGGSSQCVHPDLVSLYPSQQMKHGENHNLEVKSVVTYRIFTDLAGKPPTHNGVALFSRITYSPSPAVPSVTSSG